MPALPARPDAIQSRRGSNEQPLAGERQRGHVHVVIDRPVGAEYFELVAGLEHVADAIFVLTEYAPARRPHGDEVKAKPSGNRLRSE